MSVKFYLKDIKSTTETPIFYSINVFGFRARKSTGLKIRPQDWDGKKFRARSGVKFGLQINAYLSDLTTRSEKAKIEYITNFHRPEPAEFLARVFGQIMSKDTDLRESFGAFIEKHKRRFSTDSYKVYQTTFTNFLKFKPGTNIISGKDIDSFAEYLMDSKHSPNYVKKQVGCLKTFVESTGVKVEQKFKVQNKKSDKIALSLDELKMIKAAKLIPSLDRVRDLFIFACWTGLRYSDLQSFTKKFIQTIGGVSCLVFYSKKTQSKSVIPIFPEAAEILEKYSGSLPKRPSGQKYNEMIKDVCRLAGIDSMVQTTKLEGQSKKILTVPKYSLISSHTCRRIFITNMSIMGLTPKEISLMTGHSQMRIVDIYDKTKAEENAVKVFNRLS